MGYDTYFVFNTIVHRKPMKFFQNRSDVFIFANFTKDSCSSVLYHLKFLDEILGQSYEQGITVVDNYALMHVLMSQQS